MADSRPAHAPTPRQSAIRSRSDYPGQRSVAPSVSVSSADDDYEGSAGIRCAATLTLSCHPGLWSTASVSSSSKPETTLACRSSRAGLLLRCAQYAPRSCPRSALGMSACGGLSSWASAVRAGVWHGCKEAWRTHGGGSCVSLRISTRSSRLSVGGILGVS
jgi:hypothetical protein